jgi:uncharacterized membrane protein
VTEFLVHHFQPEPNKLAQVTLLFVTEAQNFQVALSAGNYMYSVFWDMDSIILTEFLQKTVSNKQQNVLKVSEGEPKASH